MRRLALLADPRPDGGRSDGLRRRGDADTRLERGVRAQRASRASAAVGRACAVAPAGSTAAVTVTIKNFAYTPAPAQAKVGDVVAWKNDDSAPHSATMDDGGCDTDTINAGSSAMLVFTAAGTYTTTARSTRAR